MKRLWGLATLLIFLLCGCSAGDRGKEPENTVLAQVLGIDRMGGVYLLTAAGTNEAGKPLVQTAEGATLEEAFAAMPGAGEKWVSLTNVTQLLLGDGVEPRETLTFIINKSGMSWRANVWYAPLATALMSEQEDGGIARLTLMEQAGTPVVTVLEALAGLLQEGKANLPALVIEKGKLTVSGAVEYEVKV